MPAKGNEEPHNSSSSNASQNFESLFRDCNVVDSLVYDIKENLKLTHAVAVSHAGGKMKGGRSHAMHSGVSAARGPRLHPYNVPPSSRVPCDSADPKCQSQLRKWNHQRRRYPSTCIPGGAGGGDKTTDLDDPFAMLQELITDGSLIKEAVRRLQLGLTPKLAMLATPSGGGERGNFYDSETDGDEDLDECSVSGDNHIHAEGATAMGTAE